MKPDNPTNSLLPKLGDKLSNNIIKFPEKKPIQYEIRFIFACSDPSIPFPNIVIEEI